MYLVALGAGLLVGIIYGLLNVRSPAPPVVALVGLLGILLGEQLVPAAKRIIAGQSLTSTWVRSQCQPHVLGQLPAGNGASGVRDNKEENCDGTG